jgi:predicted nuclease of predicted toxin-antitoxin system
MHFVVDAQLPPALAKLLIDGGHTAEHVANLGMEASSDSEIWDHASKTGAIIVTKDEDFRNRRNQSHDSDPVIVWLRVGNTSRKALLDWFKPLLPGIETLITQGDRLIEVR